MKKALKILFTSVLLTVLTVILCLSASAAGGISTFAVDTATASSAADLGAVKWYRNTVDGVYYIFLPNGVKNDNLKVWFNADAPVMCGSTQLVSGEATNVFAGGGHVTLTCGGNTYTVSAIESNSTATVYINTQTGSLSAIHADKSHKEAGTALIVDKDGSVQYSGKLDYIKGRGNSTWKLDKKPYNIKLDKKTDLFGMGKSKKWCLLANGGDDSFIRNALAYDFAQAIGVSETSDTIQLNLYINGNYEGFYMMTEKVEIGSNRVDIYDLEGETEKVNTAELDTYKLAGAQNSREWGTIKYAEIPNNPEVITGGYLLELEKIYRYTEEASGFITDIGQAVVVKTPEYASKAQVEYIRDYYQAFENALYSPTGYNAEGKHYSEYIDIESLARMYVLDEFATNFDGCSSSFYLYKDVDGKLVAGPAWDFDLGFGVYMSNDLINHVASLADPKLLYIQTCFIGNHRENKNALLAQAFSHNDFQDIVENIWNNDVKKYYDTVQANATKFSESASSSVIMNALRWNIYGTTDKTAILNNYSNRINGMKNHIAARFDFLSKAYAPDTHFVKYDIGDYGAALVHDTTVYEEGAMTIVKAAPKSTDELMLFKCWSTEADGSGENYAAGDELKITGDIKLYAQWEKDKSFSGRIKALQRAIQQFFAKIAAFFNGLFK